MKVRFAVGPDGGLLKDAAVVAFGDALEASGFDGVWLSDVPASPLLDPLLGLAMLAGRTRRLRLGANIVPLGRNPFLLAKSLAQLDRVSNGRLLLSFVTGLQQPGERQLLGLNDEADTRGADRVRRGALLEQALELVRSTWTGEERPGAWPSAEPAVSVRPVQAPLEVWLGGRGPKALERVGRIADGWLGAMLTPQEARAARRRIQASAVAAGREIDPEHFGHSIAYARSTPKPEILAAMRTRRTDTDPLQLLPVGAQGLRALIARYVEAGLSKFVLRPAASVASWPQEVEWLSEAVLDLQT
jgi:probable F420-dependent oxidoreductase